MNTFQKVLYSFRSDINWLNGEQCGLSSRITYLFEKYWALFTGERVINYLGGRFSYDNRNTPVTLQSYPIEIELLHNWVDFSKPTTVLDVGANVGQFSVSLKRIHSKAKIWSFEPNPMAHSLLRENTKELTNIVDFNFALGPPGKMDFYFVQGASAKGSFIEDNAKINLGPARAEKIEVELVELDSETCSQLNIPASYDLVKIDVEGFEYEVLNAIRSLKLKFIFIEFSMARAHEYTFHDLLNRLAEYFGPVEVLYCDHIDLTDSTRTIGNLLVQCGDQFG